MQKTTATGKRANDLPDVRTNWSTIDATGYGPYREALRMRLLLRLWNEDDVRQEFLRDPKAVLRRETHLTLPARLQVKVLEDTNQLFHFVLPAKPPRDQFYHRFQQIADWWMMAHSLVWWQLRGGVDLMDADRFRQALQVMIIGRYWNESGFAAEMQADAKGRLGKELGATFPDDLKVIAPVDTADLVHVVIPKRPREERLIEQSQHLAGWFAAAHQFWWWLVQPRLLSPLGDTPENKLLA